MERTDSKITNLTSLKVILLNTIDQMKVKKIFKRYGTDINALSKIVTESVILRAI